MFHLNFTNYTTSVCRLSNQVDKISEEIPNLSQKLRDLYKDLEKISAEIKSSKHGNLLKIYLKNKHLEIQCSKKSFINKHITSIVADLNLFSIWLQKGFNLASQVIKNGTLSAQQRFHYEELEQHFSDTNELEFFEFSINDVNPTSSDEDGDLNKENMKLDQSKLYFKRLRLDEYDLDDLDDVNYSSADDEAGCGVGVLHTTFKMPTKRLKVINENHMQSNVDSNGNETFYMGPSTSSALSSITRPVIKNGKVLTSNKSNMVSNLISDQMIKTQANVDQLKNVLLKSKKFTHGNLLRAVSAGVQKENKKFSPNRIRKSPRTMVTKVFNTAAASLIKQRQTTRLANGGVDAPIVRTNRAASFRVKK